MLQAGKGPQDILNYGEAVKAFFKARPKPQLTPISRTTPTSFFLPLLQILEVKTASSIGGGSGAQASGRQSIKNHFLRFG